MAQQTVSLTLPSGYKAWGGNSPTAVLSADGSVFWGLNVYQPNGKLIYAVFRQIGSAAATPVDLPGPPIGQGKLVLQPNGELWVVVFTTQGNAAPAVAYVVPGYQPF